MKLSKKDVGFGKYGWYIDNKLTDLSEQAICELVEKRKGKKGKREFFGLLNYYGNFEMEI